MLTLNEKVKRSVSQKIVLVLHCEAGKATIRLNPLIDPQWEDKVVRQLRGWTRGFPEGGRTIEGLGPPVDTQRKGNELGLAKQLDPFFVVR